MSEQGRESDGLDDTKAHVFKWGKTEEAPEEPVVRSEGEDEAEDEPDERKRWY
jgi:hypothetical protein